MNYGIARIARVASGSLVPLLFISLLVSGLALSESEAATLECRKVVAPEASAEGRNPLEASRVRCGEDEFLTGGTCYPAERPEADGSCQTSAMGIIQTLADSPKSTQGAFFTCMQTGGTDCPVEERTRAMAVCCKIAAD